jgi:hypothetical protein
VQGFTEQSGLWSCCPAKQSPGARHMRTRPSLLPVNVTLSFGTCATAHNTRGAGILLNVPLTSTWGDGEKA